jgi:hypothetical protein
MRVRLAVPRKSRYRLMWPLLVVHGAVNAAPILLGLL